MKKSLLILFFFPMICFGQNKSFELGLLFGGSFNSLNHTEANQELQKNIKHKKSLRPIGGFVAQYNFTKRFSIKSKLLYHIKGEKLTFNTANEGAVSQTVQKDLHYAKIPFLAQLNFGKNKWRFFGNTGFYLAGLINLEGVYDEGDEINEWWEETYPIENFNKFEFGLVLAYGASFQANETIRVFLESSFDYGLSNIYKAEFPNNETIFSEAMTGTIGIAYSFTNKRKVFNGTSKLECADHEEKINLDEKKKSKWRLVLYKDGKKVGGKSKKGKSRLFKKKN